MIFWFLRFLTAEHINSTWEHNHDTMGTSLLWRATVNASSSLCSDINLESSLVGSKGASTCWSDKACWKFSYRISWCNMWKQSGRQRTFWLDPYKEYIEKENFTISGSPPIWPLFCCMPIGFNPFGFAETSAKILRWLSANSLVRFWVIDDAELIASCKNDQQAQTTRNATKIQKLKKKKK